MRFPRIQNPIRGFAVLCVAVIATFIMAMRYRQLEVLASPDWCNRALKAEQLAESSRFDAAMACVGLQTIQIRSIATNSLVDGGTLALCLLVLIVIVIAGGKLSLSASKTGVNANIGKEVENAAQAVADEAQDAATDIKAGAKPVAKPDDPKIPDYAKP